jgi:hypothetical protein
MVRAGVPQSVAMSISGHRTVSTFLRYDIASDADKREALRAVSQQVMTGTANVVTISGDVEELSDEAPQLPVLSSRLLSVAPADLARPRARGGNRKRTDSGRRSRKHSLDPVAYCPRINELRGAGQRACEDL